MLRLAFVGAEAEAPMAGLRMSRGRFSQFYMSANKLSLSVSVVLDVGVATPPRPNHRRPARASQLSRGRKLIANLPELPHGGAEGFGRNSTVAVPDRTVQSSFVSEKPAPAP